MDVSRGHVAASFEVSTENARILSIEAGIKINVVPGKAHATITGLTEEEVRPMAEGVTKETGVQFELQAEEDVIVITAVGEGAHASTPEEGKNCAGIPASASGSPAICILRTDEADSQPD